MKLTEPAAVWAGPPAAFAAPAADTPIINPASVPKAQRHLIAAYDAPSWPLRPLTQNPSTAAIVLEWEPFAPAFRESCRHAAWAMINHPLPESVMRTLPPHSAPQLSMPQQHQTIQAWRGFTAFLAGRGVTSLAHVGDADFTAYARSWREQGLTRAACLNKYVRPLNRLHYYSALHLPPGRRLPEPPWQREGVDDYLPPAAGGGENSTEPIAPQTMGPLLVWAMRFVEEFADDILAAFDEHERIRLSAYDRRKDAPGDEQKVISWLEEQERLGQPVPICTWAGRTAAKPGVFVAGLLAVHPATALRVLSRKRWADYANANPGTCPLDSPVAGRIGGAPWIDGFDYYQISALRAHLATACLIVISYLTGMRGGEVLGLQAGCCPEPADDGIGPKRFLIWSRHFKHARDENNVHVSAGLMRETPWLAIPPVVKAIRVLERQAGGSGLLFEGSDRDVPDRDSRPARSLDGSTLGRRVERFINWVNELVQERGLAGQEIPPDPKGWIGISRFRRTLAWHIARRPGGLVALAVQYGHMRTIVSEGYAARSRDGVHELLDLETARSIAERLSDLHEAIENGQGVSGPAAARLIDSASHGHARFAGMVATPRQAKALLADPTLTVYDNERSFLLCNYNRAKALCHRGGPAGVEAPSLDRCQKNCANIARTDTHAVAMRAAAADLDSQAAAEALPAPITERIRAAAVDLREAADRHDADRLIVASGT